MEVSASRHFCSGGLYRNNTFKPNELCRATLFMSRIKQSESRLVLARIPLSLRFSKSSRLPVLASKVEGDLKPDVSETVETSVDLETIKVTFLLERECKFGEQFSVAGDDPLLGSWDPTSALPLQWSEGHKWTAELDFPVGKKYEYKFVLNGRRDSTIWQPGPNRTFETVAELQPLTVSSVWDFEEVSSSTPVSDSENVSEKVAGEEGLISSESQSAVTTPIEKTDDEQSESLKSENTGGDEALSGTEGVTPETVQEKRSDQPLTRTVDEVKENAVVGNANGVKQIDSSVLNPVEQAGAKDLKQTNVEGVASLQASNGASVPSSPVPFATEISSTQEKPKTTPIDKIASGTDAVSNLETTEKASSSDEKSTEQSVKPSAENSKAEADQASTIQSKLTGAGRGTLVEVSHKPKLNSAAAGENARTKGLGK